MNQDHKATEQLKPLLHKLNLETKTYKKTIEQQTIKAREVYRA